MVCASRRLDQQNISRFFEGRIRRILNPLCYLPYGHAPEEGRSQFDWKKKNNELLDEFWRQPYYLPWLGYRRGVYSAVVTVMLYVMCVCALIGQSEPFPNLLKGKQYSFKSRAVERFHRSDQSIDPPYE